MNASLCHDSGLVYFVDFVAVFSTALIVTM